MVEVSILEPDEEEPEELELEPDEPDELEPEPDEPELLVCEKADCDITNATENTRAKKNADRIVFSRKRNIGQFVYRSRYGR